VHARREQTNKEAKQVRVLDVSCVMRSYGKKCYDFKMAGEGRMHNGMERVACMYVIFNFSILKNVQFL
jgi:hypothetical protein